MFWVIVYKIMYFLHWHTVNDICEDHYEEMVMDDTIDIKNFHRAEIGSENYKDRRKQLKKRRNWYLRHGYFDLAEDIDIAFWTMERKT